jgi:4,5-dihydroxyphthalate decarboxylase
MPGDRASLARRPPIPTGQRLPVFVMRRFHHSGFVVRPDSGIRAPKDIEGKNVGVRAYSVTTGVWTRGIFINDYGLGQARV